jgi:hypothetical protein
LTVTKFNAETHARYITNAFQHLNISPVNRFAIAQTTDNTNLNPAIAKDLSIEQVGCRNHLLNLGCQGMEEKCADLKRVSTMTQEVHQDVKSSNCLSAEFENIQASLQHMEDGSSKNPQYKKLKGRSKT